MKTGTLQTEGVIVTAYYYDSGVLHSLRCPHCKSIVDMEQYPSKYVGIWVCENCDSTGTCDHVNRHVESFAIDGMDFGGHRQREEDGYVCDDCGKALDGSPAADRHDSMIDSQVMEALGK